MPYRLTSNHVQAVLTTLCGSYDIELADCKIRLLARALPGIAVCSILPDLGDGILRIVYDVAKPNAFQHTQQMVSDWWESFRQPVEFPDGSVEMLSLPSPIAGAGPVRVAVLEQD